MHNRLADGVELFNAGHFFDAHEAWEDVWRESSEPERRWLQGLVQTTVALHHESTGNRTGAASVLDRAIANLETCPETLQGIDVRQLKMDLARARAELAAAIVITRFQIRKSQP